MPTCTAHIRRITCRVAGFSSIVTVFYCFIIIPAYTAHIGKVYRCIADFSGIVTVYDCAIIISTYAANIAISTSLLTVPVL